MTDPQPIVELPITLSRTVADDLRAEAKRRGGLNPASGSRRPAIGGPFCWRNPAQEAAPTETALLFFLRVKRRLLHPHVGG
jgi:hypothetical protein